MNRHEIARLIKLAQEATTVDELRDVLLELFYVLESENEREYLDGGAS